MTERGGPHHISQCISEVLDILEQMHDTSNVRPGHSVSQWDNRDEPDRGGCTPQPDSDRLHLAKKGGGW